MHGGVRTWKGKEQVPKSRKVCLFASEGSQEKKQYSGSEEQEMLEWVTEEVAETPFLESFKNRTAIWDDLDMVLTEEGGGTGNERSL